MRFKVCIWLILAVVLVGCSSQTTLPVVPAKHAESKPVVQKEAVKPVAPSVSDKKTALLPSAAQLISESRQALSSGDLQVAAVKAERAMRISPRASEVYVALANVRIKQALFAQAEQLLMKAKSMAASSRSDVAQIWRKIAEVRELAGDIEGSRAARQEAGGFW